MGSRFLCLARAIFLPAALLLSGCGTKVKKSPPVAAVGNEEISLAEIADIIYQERRAFASAEEELAEKRRLLDSLIQLRLLVQEAYRQKLDSDSSILSFKELERPLYLIDLLYLREVREKARIPASELSRLYSELKKERCLKQILTFSQPLADSLLVLLQKGSSFDSLAQTYSRDPVSASKGGDIGCYGWSRRPPPNLFEKIVKMRPGEIFGPFAHSDGWLVVQCYAARPADLPDFKLIEPELRTIVEPFREGERSAEFVAEVRRELEFQIVDSTARFVNRMQRELSKIETPGRPAQYSIYLRTEELTPAQWNMPLVTYRGGLLAAGQYLESIQGSVPINRVVLDTSERTRAILFQLVFRAGMARAATVRGLDKDPELEKIVKQAVESQMASLLKNRILVPTKVDSQAVKTYFQAHPDEFVQPPGVHLFELNLRDGAEIINIKEQIKNKADLMTFASRLTSRTQLRATGGDMGWLEPQHLPELFVAASKLKVGEIGGPVGLRDGSYSLIYLEARRPAKQRNFSEVKEALFARFLTQAQDSVLAAWAAKEKKNTKVEVYSEVLEKSVDSERYARLKEWQARKQKEGVS